MSDPKSFRINSRSILEGFLEEGWEIQLSSNKGNLKIRSPQGFDYEGNESSVKHTPERALQYLSDVWTLMRIYKKLGEEHFIEIITDYKAKHPKP